MSYAGIFTDKNNTDHPVTSTLYGTCDTAAATAAKVVTCADVDALTSGMTIRVKFTNANTAASPTINVNSTGAKTVYRFGTTAPVDGDSWRAGEVVELLYDGTYFYMVSADDIGSKQDTLTFDDVPTDNSNNPVKSNGIYDALALKQNATDNSLQTTDKTVVGAINEHEGDIDSLKSGLTNVDVALNVPDGTGKNILMNTKIPQSETTAGVTLTALYDADGYWCGFSFTGTLTRGNYGFEFASYVLKAGTYTINSVLSRTDKITAFLIYDANMEMIDYINSTSRLTSTFTISQDMTIRCFVFAYDKAGDYSGLIFRPMLRLASVTDSTYAPYIPSVDTRLDTLEAMILHHDFSYADLEGAITSLLIYVRDNLSGEGGRTYIFDGTLTITDTSSTLEYNAVITKKSTHIYGMASIGNNIYNINYYVGVSKAIYEFTGTNIVQ